MFCSQCGKKVMESMLFCPFCGSPIVIPDQDAPVEPTPVEPVPPEPISPEPQPDAQTESPRVQEEETFVPLNLEMDWSAEDVSAAPEEEQDGFVPLDLEKMGEDVPAEEELEAAPNEEVTDEISDLLKHQLREEPVKLQGHVPDLSHAAPRPEKPGARKPVNTLVPPKAFDPKDIFMDQDDEYEDEEDDYAYEEPEADNFWIRHIRGTVALGLLVVVLAIVAGWAFSGAGQTALARANLAWNPAVYESLAYRAYQNGDHLLAATYYERALSRDSDNYSYANSAGIAYYYAQDAGKAAEMAKIAIAIHPEYPDAYRILLQLYPDASTRPWEISSLLQQGYQLTGDESFKQEQS